MTITIQKSQSAQPEMPAQCDVVLVMMPFAPMKMPSLGLSMLASVLREADISVRVEYPIVDFMRAIGERDIDLIGNLFGKLSLGEWLFSRLVSPVGTIKDFMQLSRKSLRPQQVPELLRLINKARPAAAELVEETAQRIVRLSPRVVGLSSTFQQQMSSIALADRLRELMPDVKIVMGGANCSAPMGEAVFRGYPVLDGVLVGPGEIVFPRLVRAILDGETDIALPGLYWRNSATTPPADPGVAPEPSMDDLPYPDFDDFLEIWPVDSETPPLIPFEGSRGCWWGQKHHCVFCSLNHSIAFRAKDPERFYREIVYLTERFPGLQLFATDDILDPRVIGSVTDRLAALPARPRLFFQLKSNMKKEQMRALSCAGVNAILPGVESLADEVLTQMRKGVTGLRNVQMLKWAQEYGIHRISWSILYGFPFDKAEYYERMLEWVPSLTHLTAPRGLNDVRIQRYSPLYVQAEQFGVKNLRPREAYSLIYDLDQDIVDDLAYNFDWDPPEDQSHYIEPLRKQISAWLGAERSRSAFLYFAETNNGMVVGDTRAAAVRRMHRLDQIESAICKACDGVAKLHQIASAVREAGHEADDSLLQTILDRLVADRLMLQHDGFYLFLATPVPEDGSGPKAIVKEILAEAGDTVEQFAAG